MTQRGDEAGTLRRHLADTAGIDPQGQRACCLAPGDVEPQEAGAVLALEGDDMAARIHHHAGERLHACFLALGEGGGDDGVGFVETDAEVAHRRAFLESGDDPDRKSAAGKATQCRGFEIRPTIDIGLRANFETETTLGINKLSMSFDSEIRQSSISRSCEFRKRDIAVLSLAA